MEEQLQAMYERAVLESWPPSVFVELTMPHIRQQLAKVEAENERLMQRVATQQAILSPFFA